MREEPLDEHGRTKQQTAQEVLDRIQYFYMQRDGSYVFPNSADGDLLFLVLRLLTDATIRTKTTESEE